MVGVLRQLNLILVHNHFNILSLASVQYNSTDMDNDNLDMMVRFVFIETTEKYAHITQRALMVAASKVVLCGPPVGTPVELVHLDFISTSQSNTCMK